MKASDTTRAAMLFEALRRTDRVSADLRKEPRKGYDVRALELMAVSFNDRENLDCDADLYVDAVIALKLMPMLRDLIEQELRAMGVEVEE